jgi:hypothetical protein
MPDRRRERTMTRETVRQTMATTLVWAVVGTALLPAPASAQYKVVPACSLMTLDEVKRLAPWSPHLDAFAKAEEEPLGSYGSACEYPTVRVQVMAYRQQTMVALRKDGKLEAIGGIADEAYVRNNGNRFAELYARTGPHLLTLQLGIDDGRGFEATKPSLVELAKAFVARLR